MSQSKLPASLARLAEETRDVYAKALRLKKNWHFENPECRGPLPLILQQDGYMFMVGVEWLWSHLSEQAPEFDEMAAENAAIQQANICIDEYKSGKSLWAICELAFRNGASWQFDQMKAREAALRASGQALTNIHTGLEQKHYLLTKERDELRANIEADTVQLAAYVNRLLDRIAALEKECGRDPGNY